MFFQKWIVFNALQGQVYPWQYPVKMGIFQEVSLGGFFGQLLQCERAGQWHLGFHFGHIRLDGIQTHLFGN